MKSNSTTHALFITCSAVAVTLAVAMIHTPALADPSESPGEGGPTGGPPLLEMSVETSYAVGGATKFRGTKFGDSDAFDMNIGVSILKPLNEKWFIPFEIQSKNLDFGSPAGVPMPDAVNTLEFGTGLAYRPNDRWMFTARIGAELYKLEDVGGNDVGVSGGLLAMWEYGPSLQWMFGLMVQPDNDLPVLPLVGVNWRIREQWELQLMLLSPRLTYSLDDRWKLHAGMGLNFGNTFRTSDTLGTSLGLPRYNDALGSYSDMRFGGGFAYQLGRSFSLEAEAGYSMSREIDYTNVDEKVKFEPAAYSHLGLKYEF